jgi:hypothetical protein
LLADKIGGYLLPYMKELNQFILDLVAGKANLTPTIAKMTPQEQQAKKNDTWNFIKSPSRWGELFDISVKKMGDQPAGPTQPASPAQPASGNTTGGKPTAQSIIGYLEKMGWGAQQASALAANAWHESGFNPNAVNGSHFGIAQWDSHRQKDFAAWAGHDIHSSNLEEQLAFMNYELTQGKYKGVGNQLRNTQSPWSAGELVNRAYEVSGSMSQGVLRGNLAQKYYNQSGPAAPTVNQTTHITVTGSNTPQDTAHAIAGAQTQVNSQLVRNVAGAVQ